MQIRKSLPKPLRKWLTKLLLEQEDFPKAAPGTGAILYGRGPTPFSLIVGCARRSAVVGQGYGISFGGFFEVNSLFRQKLHGIMQDMPLGTIIMMLREAYREATEEIPGIERIIPYEEFERRALFLTAFGVRTADANKAQTCTYYGCPTTAAERSAIALLPPSTETEVPLEFLTIHWLESNGGEPVLQTPLPLFHTHEMEAFRALVNRAATGTLPYLE